MKRLLDHYRRMARKKYLLLLKEAPSYEGWSRVRESYEVEGFIIRTYNEKFSQYTREDGATLITIRGKPFSYKDSDYFMRWVDNSLKSGHSYYISQGNISSTDRGLGISYSSLTMTYLDIKVRYVNAATIDVSWLDSGRVEGLREDNFWYIYEAVCAEDQKGLMRDWYHEIFSTSEDSV